MSDWSLQKLLSGLHDDIQRQLDIARKNLAHPVSKGTAAENVWLELFEVYLPKRYQAASAHVVDSNGQFSEQIDVLVFDRQYSPFIFSYKEQLVVPAESVYAVFEAKQSIDVKNIKYAQQKVRSVRRLHRTSLPIPHAGGTYPAKPPIKIFGGVLAFDSEWKDPPLGEPLEEALNRDKEEGRLDIGCVAARGYFCYDRDHHRYRIIPNNKAATAFLFELISALQFSGTVPMIDIRAYARQLI